MLREIILTNLLGLGINGEMTEQKILNGFAWLVYKVNHFSSRHTIDRITKNNHESATGMYVVVLLNSVFKCFVLVTYRVVKWLLVYLCL